MIKTSPSLRFFVALLLVTLVSACSTSPTGRSQLLFLSNSESRDEGIKAFEKIKNEIPIVTDTKHVDYVNCIVDAIVEELDTSADNSASTDAWEVLVFDTDSVNAFALPGKKIGVYTGLMHPSITHNQHQLATVIGHEMAHVLAEHSNERLSRQLLVDVGLNTASQILGGKNIDSGRLIMAGLGLGAEVGILLPFSRSHESEADIYGLQLIARSGFDPRESAKLWENIASSKSKTPHALLSTHPSDEERIQQLNAYTETVGLDLYQEAQAAGKQPNCQQFYY